MLILKVLSLLLSLRYLYCYKCLKQTEYFYLSKTENKCTYTWFIITNFYLENKTDNLYADLEWRKVK
jgi:hypothetical protein